MQDFAPPTPECVERPGRWVAEPAWPSANVSHRPFGMVPGRLTPDGSGAGHAVVCTPQHHGITAGNWCPYGLNADKDWDQRRDDGLATCFDSEPLREPLEIMGAPVLELRLSADRANALLCARLCDVAPDGTSLRVSYGLLNLTHRDSHSDPEPLVPGESCTVRLQLNDIAHGFRPGHRVRLALSTAYWPIAWPSPDAATLALDLAESELQLPVRLPRPEDERLPAFAQAESAPPEQRTSLEPGSFERRFAYDVATDTMTYTSLGDSGLERIDAHGLELREVSRKTYRVAGNDPLSTEHEIAWTTLRQRGDWSVRVETRTVMRSTREHFHIDARIEAYEGEREVFTREWHEQIPRDLV
jgi:hypothetical protein